MKSVFWSTSFPAPAIKWLFCLLGVSSIVAAYFDSEAKGTTFDGPYSNIWGDDECRYIGRYDGQSLLECKLRCTQSPDCTAINFNMDDCVLRACKLPVPQPQWNFPPYQGYKIDKARGNSCLEENGICLPKKAAKKYCAGKTDKSYKCDGKQEICCNPGGCHVGCPGDDGVFEENNGNCFHFSSVALTWTQARHNCKTIGNTLGMNVDLAELGNPNNLGSDEWLMQRIAAKGELAWLGAYDPGQNDNWIWTYSEQKLPIEFLYWGPDEPSGDGSCVDVWPNGNRGRYYLNDQNCDDQHIYVCQIFY